MSEKQEKLSEKQDKLAEKQDKLAEEQRKTTKALQQLEMTLTKREAKLVEGIEKLAADREELDLEKKRKADDARLDDGLQGWRSAGDLARMEECRVENRLYKDRVRDNRRVEEIQKTFKKARPKKQVCATFCVCQPLPRRTCSHRNRPSIPC